MRNDLIVAGISFTVGVMITWMTYVTLSIFDFKTELAVTKVKVERLTEDISKLEEDE